jgi:hypothetical protein
MARRYNVQGTQTYLIAAVFCLLIALWHAYDGWLPRATVRRDHPQEITLRAPVAGTIAELSATNEVEVYAATPLLTLKPSDEEIEQIKLNMVSGMDEKSKVQHGRITAVHVAEGQQVEANERLVELAATRDSYYLYNKTTAIIFFIAAAVCAYIHKASR